MPLLKADRTAIAAAVAAARADNSIPMTDIQAYATIERLFPAATYPQALGVGMPEVRDKHRLFKRQVYKALTWKSPPPVILARRKIVIKLIVRREPEPEPESEPVKKWKKSKG
ncbi:hypothetical protein IFR05_010294 [Cadophora sp. M221]|nr:hypothetical protein IFR05_010294 [Cadophora sp. M221]